MFDACDPDDRVFTAGSRISFSLEWREGVVVDAPTGIPAGYIRIELDDGSQIDVPRDAVLLASHHRLGRRAAESAQTEQSTIPASGARRYPPTSNRTSPGTLTA
jgi:hypothetical protein